jgi:hypothetical protein
MQTYRSPGVYRQDVFVKPKAALPTGVPGFIGFADEAATGSAGAWVALAELPVGAVLPDRVSYDAALKRLTVTGPMTAATYGRLAALSTEDAYRQAAKNLYRKSQGMLNKAVEIRRSEEYSAFFRDTPAESYLADAVKGFFDNGGVSCYIVHADACLNLKDALTQALDALSTLTDLDLVAVPDAMTLPEEACLSVQQAALAHCSAQGNRFAILDSLPGASAEWVLDRQCVELRRASNEAMNGALYFPWMKTAAGRMVPPCGHVAGIYARTDGKAGVQKAPANEEVRGIIDLHTPVDNSVQDRLNPEGVNCIRAFPGRGIRVWGARTLSRDATWRYVNVRRLVLTLGRWIDANMTWAAFEPNTPRLWIRIQRELSVRLERLWQAGALKGDTADQAFYVKCDAETNPAEERDVGNVITEIGLAPANPAEFIVVRIIHRAGTTELD